MKLQGILVLTAALIATPLASKADSAPFGVASAYNLTALTGNIGTSADIGGRIAAAGQVTGSITVMSSLNGDPYGAGVTWAIIAQNGMTGSGNVNDHGVHGDVYSPTGANVNINNNGDGHVITTGGSPINFTTLADTLDAQTAYLGSLGTTGQILGFGRTPAGGTTLTGINPSNYVLYGTDPTLNVFTLDAAGLAAASAGELDIRVPAGSTVIINVTGGGTVTLDAGGTVLLNGQQYHGDSTNTENILWNVPNATQVNISNGFSGSILAPYANLTTNQQIAGTFIFGSISSTGEVHYVAFEGNLPNGPTPPPSATPEPGSLMLAGTGLFAVAGFVRRKRMVKA
jgi:choice-of-anchor A domain-containing protein